MKKILLTFIILLIRSSNIIIADIPIKKITEGDKNAKITIITYE